MRLDKIAKLSILDELVLQLEQPFYKLSDEQINDFLQLQHLNRIEIRIFWRDDLQSFFKTIDLLKQLLPRTRIEFSWMAREDKD